MGPLRQAGGLALIWLLVAGGLCYSVGAVFYGLRWPGRNARYFGYHEIFHAGTVAGWTCICIAAYFAVLA
ncbi:MAG: hemolysin III family protein, partial [Varibaculum cambriense]|nr:hemolysin III family protein [Varibaculum cambriense]